MSAFPVPDVMLTARRLQDAESVFKEACASFRESLPDFDKGEFREFESAEVMISELQSLAETHPVHKAKLTAFVRRLHAFTSKVEPYFEIINIFAQIKADVSSAVWGSLRVLFKVRFSSKKAIPTKVAQQSSSFSLTTLRTWMTSQTCLVNYMTLSRYTATSSLGSKRERKNEARHTRAL